MMLVMNQPPVCSLRRRSARAARWALAAGVLAAGAPGPARAANKDVERLQTQVVGLQGQVSDLARALDETVRELRRLNEGLAEQNALLRRSAQDAHAADEDTRAALRDLSERLGASVERLDQRLAALAARPAPAAEPTSSGEGDTGGAAPAPPVAGGVPAGGLPGPRELYSQAYADYARGNYDLAIQGFQEYLRAAPGSDLADNAQYWVGECLYGKQRFAEAIEAWNALLRDYSGSDKLPDARVKKGMALERLGRRTQALIEYRYVVDRYPKSSAARIARDRLPN
jgi:tol-pal system protein YbgF